MFCRNCGNKLKENDQFCGKCGGQVTSVAEPFSSNTPSKLAPQVFTEKKRKRKQPVVIVAVVALVVVLVAGFFLLGRSSPEMAVKKYYEAIEEKDYEKAWSFYSEEYKFSNLLRYDTYEGWKSITNTERAITIFYDGPSWREKIPYKTVEQADGRAYVRISRQQYFEMIKERGKWVINNVYNIWSEEDDIFGGQ